MSDWIRKGHLGLFLSCLCFLSLFFILFNPAVFNDMQTRGKQLLPRLLLEFPGRSRFGCLSSGDASSVVVVMKFVVERVEFSLPPSSPPPQALSCSVSTVVADDLCTSPGSRFRLRLHPLSSNMAPFSQKYDISSSQSTLLQQSWPRQPRPPGLRFGVSSTSRDDFPQNLRSTGVNVINSVEPSTTDALRSLHPGVCASSASVTSVGEIVVVYVLVLLVFCWSKDLFVILSSFED